VSTIAVLDYGSGNLHSVSRALEHVGGEALVTGDPAEVAAADALLIPGVGHFGQCVRALRITGLDGTIQDFVGTGRPVIGVCVGMQVLFETSDESDEPGLGVLPGRVRRLSDRVRVPHIGWNTVEWSRLPHEHPFLMGLDGEPMFYFVHSYAPDAGNDFAAGTTHHGRAFTSVVAKENVFATQFHPEKSGDAGLRLYENVVKAVAA
jgi:imidazole glycerol-phosphate synthase subunit HisH